MGSPQRGRAISAAGRYLVGGVTGVDGVGVCGVGVGGCVTDLGGVGVGGGVGPAVGGAGVGGCVTCAGAGVGGRVTCAGAGGVGVGGSIQSATLRSSVASVGPSRRQNQLQTNCRAATASVTSNKLQEEEGIAARELLEKLRTRQTGLEYQQCPKNLLQPCHSASFKSTDGK